jgi:hypothetical protein
MKKDDIFEMKTLLVDDHGVKVPEGWRVVKDATKVSENGVDVFKAVIARPKGKND